MYPCCAKLFLLSPESVYPLSCTSFLEITVIDVYVERNYFSSIFFSILLTERSVECNVWMVSIKYQSKQTPICGTISSQWAGNTLFYFIDRGRESIKSQNGIFENSKCNVESYLIKTRQNKAPHSVFWILMGKCKRWGKYCQLRVRRNSILINFEILLNPW